jgi:glycosyltransferase involved in cell wall biosynthesis
LSARLIDLTRLASRAGKGPPTGIDRVEAAWLRYLLGAEGTLFGLVRSAAGFLLLDRAGLQAAAPVLLGQAPPPPPDLMGRLLLSRDPRRAGTEAHLRAQARARCPRPLLGAMLRRHLPPQSLYLNLGHANLTDGALRAIGGAGARVCVLVHDTIPLDHPRLSRLGTPEAFARRMQAVSARADLVIHTATTTRALTEAHLARMGRLPPGIVAPLGVDAPPVGSPPPGLLRGRPHFVALGTIEPRKNHALLLDIWEEMMATRPADTIPDLLILGRRGWADRALLDRLDRLTADPDSPVREAGGLADPEVGALLAGARALLFPSLAEGYGLPPMEAAALGVPVIAAPLPVLVEILGDYPVYASTSERYDWIHKIWTTEPSAGAQRVRGADHGGGMWLPTWDDHFKAVLSFA